MQLFFLALVADDARSCHPSSAQLDGNILFAVDVAGVIHVSCWRALRN